MSQLFPPPPHIITYTFWDGVKMSKNQPYLPLLSHSYAYPSLLFILLWPPDSPFVLSLKVPEFGVGKHNMASWMNSVRSDYDLWVTASQSAAVPSALMHLPVCCGLQPPAGLHLLGNHTDGGISGPEEWPGSQSVQFCANPQDQAEIRKGREERTLKSPFPDDI